MKKIFHLSIFLILISCQTIENKMDRRINLFENYKDEFFNSMYIRSNREIYNPEVLEFDVIKFDNKFNGHFQTKPRKYWHHNGDTLSFDFIEVFSKLDCRKLYNFEEYAYLEFLDKKKRVILFKGNPNDENYYIKTLPHKAYKDGWSYIVVDFKGEKNQ